MCFACVGEAAPSDPQVVLTVDWQDCLDGRQQTFFTLDFLPDGTVTYEGKNEIREKGTRVARIDSRHVRQLVQSATKAVSPGAPQAKTSPYEERPLFCLKLKVGDGSSLLTGNVSPEDKPGKKLHRQLLRYLDLRPWVCPTRGWAPEEMARCAPSPIFFSFIERETCYASHAVHLWPDGQVYYYANKVADSDRYYKIDPAVVKRLFEIGWQLEGGPVFAGMQHDHKVRHFQNPSALIEYKQTLTVLANVPWQPLPLSEDNSCSDDRLVFPQGTVSLYR